jgi:hypothetical protein
VQNQQDYQVAANPYQKKGPYVYHADPKCDLPIPDGVILPYSSGAPYPPALNEYYLPVAKQPDIKDTNVKQVADKPRANQKKKSKNNWSEGPTYTFIASASEQLFQTAVPQDLAAQKGNDNKGAHGQSTKVQNNGWTPISGRTYNSYTFPCKGKADGLYADVNYNCEVYYKCKDNGIDKKFKCPSGMRFNKTIESCDFGHQVMCGHN